MKKHRLIPVAAIAVTFAAFTINAPQAFPETAFQGLSADTLPGDTIDDPLPADTSGLPDDTLPADTSVFPPEDFFPSDTTVDDLFAPDQTDPFPVDTAGEQPRLFPDDTTGFKFNR